MRSQWRTLTDDLARAMAAGDNAAVRECHRRIIAAARGRSPAEPTAAIENLAPVLGMACGVYSKTAVPAGALVE
jgi:hypothetical protein